MARTTLRKIATVTGSAAVITVIGVTLLGASAASATTAPSGTGSLSIAITAPILWSKSGPAAVNCVTTGHTYRMSTTSRSVHGSTATVNVVIVGYKGPGSYSAAVAVSVHQANGAVVALALPKAVPTKLTAAGGSVTVNKTGHAGRPVAAQASWTCATS